MAREKSRRQCRECGAHTVTNRCGNCLSRSLGPVDGVEARGPETRMRVLRMMDAAWRPAPGPAVGAFAPRPHF